MKNHLLLCGLAATLFLVPVRADDDTPLAKEMSTMNDAYKALRDEKDPAKGAALAREAQTATLKSALEMPEMLKKMPDSPSKAKAAVEYRKMMGKLYISFCEVEEAFLNGKMEDVAKLVAALKDMKKAGHEKFVEE